MLIFSYEVNCYMLCLFFSCEAYWCLIFSCEVPVIWSVDFSVVKLPVIWCVNFSVAK